jgi:hypothetical protein
MKRGSVAISGCSTGKDRRTVSTCEQLGEQDRGLRLAQDELERGVARAHERQGRGEEIRRDGRDRAEHQPAREGAAAIAGIIRQVPHASEDHARPSCDFLARIGQLHPVSPPLDQGCAEPRLEFLNLHGQGRLGYRAFLRGAAEMPQP